MNEITSEFKPRWIYATVEDLHLRYNDLKRQKELTAIEKEELQRLTYVVNNIFKEEEPTQEDCDNCFGAERYHHCKHFTENNECTKGNVE